MDKPVKSTGPGALPHYTRIRDQLRSDIVDGLFKGDERLVLAGLCERYGVSMPPIREALNQLQVEGLVVIEPNRGARVREITSDFIKDIFDIRILLEPALLVRSLPSLTEADFSDLFEIQEQFEEAISQGDRSRMLAGNDRFHHRIYRVDPNREAIRLMRQHDAVIGTMRRRFGYKADRLEQIIYEHHAILRACRNRDADLAAAIATSHIRNSVTDLIDLTAS
ncbi:MAG: GntR family transcriptional regulator [Roseitalea sp.]|jgi:DNA-binding GntR family transcriptional regulator|nr:GntR family transcriptional regulator [Roseitalea sp.]MBO6720758.1 GntR family transcriptional regulator [Roseitalea sp.]MBO6743905.1 GntR family transcriptional regulator [Roseitalea sp.]